MLPVDTVVLATGAVATDGAQVLRPTQRVVGWVGGPRVEQAAVSNAEGAAINIISQ